MKNLRNSSLLLMALSISACQSAQVFQLKTMSVNGDKSNDLHVIQVDTNRVQQKCLFFNAEAENSWRHQYFMYILNDKNEVLEVMHSLNQDRETCNSQIQQIEKILRVESKVKLCVHDELKKNSDSSIGAGEIVKFGSLGDHRIRFENLTFDSICNSKKCFSRNAARVNTCPGFPKESTERQ